MSRSTVIDQLSTLGTCLKTKAIGWAFVRTGHLIGSGRLLKRIKKKRDNKVFKHLNVRHINFSKNSQIPSKIPFKTDHKNPSFPFV